MFSNDHLRALFTVIPRMYEVIICDLFNFFFKITVHVVLITGTDNGFLQSIVTNIQVRDSFLIDCAFYFSLQRNQFFRLKDSEYYRNGFVPMLDVFIVDEFTFDLFRIDSNKCAIAIYYCMDFGQIRFVYAIDRFEYIRVIFC